MANKNTNKLFEGDSCGGAVCTSSAGGASSIGAMAPENTTACVVTGTKPTSKKHELKIEERIAMRKAKNAQLAEAIKNNDVESYLKTREMPKRVNYSGSEEYEKQRKNWLKNKEKHDKTIEQYNDGNPSRNPIGDLNMKSRYEDGQVDEFLSWFEDHEKNRKNTKKVKESVDYDYDDDDDEEFFDTETEEDIDIEDPSYWEDAREIDPNTAWEDVAKELHSKPGAKGNYEDYNDEDADERGAYGYERFMAAEEKNKFGSNEGVVNNYDEDFSGYVADYKEPGKIYDNEDPALYESSKKKHSSKRIRENIESSDLFIFVPHGDVGLMLEKDYEDLHGLVDDYDAYTLRADTIKNLLNEFADAEDADIYVCPEAVAECEDPTFQAFSEELEKIEDVYSFFEGDF